MVIENVNNNGNVEPLGSGQELELIDKMLFARSLLDMNISDRSVYLSNALKEQANLNVPQVTSFNNTSITKVNSLTTMDYLKIRNPFSK